MEWVRFFYIDQVEVACEIANVIFEIVYEYSFNMCWGYMIKPLCTVMRLRWQLFLLVVVK